MRLPLLLCVSNSLLKDLLRLFYQLTMQINRVIGNAACCIVLSEDKIRGLLIILVYLDSMLLAFLRKLMCKCAITPLEGLTGLYRAVSRRFGNESKNRIKELCAESRSRNWTDSVKT
jgi:hypothetical protein